jgi:hypothetical protein
MRAAKQAPCCSSLTAVFFTADDNITVHHFPDTAWRALHLDDRPDELHFPEATAAARANGQTPRRTRRRRRRDSITP